MKIAGITLAVAIVMMVIEALTPGRNWPRVKGWWPRAIFLNLVQGASVFVVGKNLDPWLSLKRPWSIDDLGPELGAVVGYLAITFIYYWWHRWRHEIGFLWRWIHQIHHSPQRIEIITSFYKHPLEIGLNGLLSSAILFLLVGCSPEAAAGAVLISGLAELVYHWNVPTPYWLGFFFQRPESHCVHHQENHHRQNFGDLPLWDMLFGTFYNPKQWQLTCGLGADNESRLGAMLVGVDVTAHPLPGAEEGETP